MISFNIVILLRPTVSEVEKLLALIMEISNSWSITLFRVTLRDKPIVSGRSFLIRRGRNIRATGGEYHCDLWFQLSSLICREV